MPDPFDFDDARRALDEVPAPDLWDEASQRAAGGAIVPLDSLGEPRRPHRWLAAAGVAAVAALAVGTTAVLLDDDDQAVDTTPVTSPTTDPGTMLGGGDVCGVGISGYPLVMGPADPPLFDTSGQAEGQLVAHTMLGSQVAELHVPGLVLTDLVGERVEQVELARGTADLWFGPDFVQVRWFTGGQELCESFTVTVAGGTEDGNRHAAVDLAERVLLPSELGEAGAGVELDGTEWQLERSTIDGVPTDGNGAVFTFADGEVGWTDGCQSFGASYTQPSPSQLVLGDVSSTELPCPTNPTSQAIAAVMSSGAIEVERNELLALSAGETTLTLRPADGSSPDDTPSAGTELAGTEWRVAALYRGDEVVLAGPAAGELTFSFGDSTVGWDDGCNSASGTWSLDPETGAIVVLVVTDATTTAIDCADAGEGTQAWEVIGAVMGSDRIYLDEMGGLVELSDTEGNHITLEPR